MTIFRVKSVKKKFTLAKKNLHEYIRGVRDKYQVWIWATPASWCSHVWCVLPICLDLTYSDLWESPMLRISSSVVHLLIHPILPGFFILWWSDHPTICLERLSWGKIVSSRCSSVLLVLLSKWPSLKDVISKIKTSSVWQRWYIIFVFWSLILSLKQ